MLEVEAALGLDYDSSELALGIENPTTPKAGSGESATGWTNRVVGRLIRN